LMYTQRGKEKMSSSVSRRSFTEYPLPWPKSSGAVSSRLTATLKGEHHLTIPRHKPLKIGTLSGILGEVGSHVEITRESLIRELFQRK
jgi:hypothetical protein